MCINFKLFKNLFNNNQEKEPIENEVLEEIVSNEEIVPESGTTELQHETITETEGKEMEKTNFVILLDNGHAKSTAGKRSPKMDDGRIFYEWEFNRDVVARIAKGLDKLVIKYHILVPEVEKDVALTERANRANAYCKKYGTKNCLFVSVHANAFGDGKKWEDPGKWSVWTTVGVTQSDAYGEVFYDVADEMLRPYGFGCRNGKVQGNGNDGPDYESNFTVLYKTWCPAVLTENMFYTNKRECEWLMTDEGRQVIANIHIEAIRRIIDNL